MKRYPIDTLQLYFAASLELQEELISHGFYVPKSPDGRVVMPVPLIYSNFRGWLKPPEPVTIERLIPPEWLDLTFQQLGWIKSIRGRKEAYVLPQEEVYVSVGVRGSSVVLDLDVRGYHLERTSIRGVNPDKWTNWAMLYVSAEYLDELVAALRSYLPSYYGSLVPGGTPKPRREVQQGGKEVTYYVEVPVEEFSLCLGCFDLVQRYLNVKVREHCVIDPNSALCRDPHSVINGLRLRLTRSHAVRTFAKVGVAKISGKRPQVMVKLASDEPRITIRGVLKDRVEGKARGELVYCNHEVRKQYLALNLVSFYNALVATSKYLNMLPKEA
ncbi:MAG: PhoI [Desulfurococcaceae archaeon]